MPYVQINVNEIIKKKCKEDKSFETTWEESREEYRLIGEMIELRKSKKITQSQLATITGNKQQVISRIERKESTPTLRTFCNLLGAIGYELKIVKKKSV